MAFIDTDNALKKDELFFEKFYHYVMNDTEAEVVRRTVLGKYFPAELFMEEVISTVGGFSRKSTKSMDFEDGSDCKTCVSSIRSKTRLNTYLISSLSAKVGWLRVVTLNLRNEKFHYYLIPYNQYAGLSRIEIGLNYDTGEIKNHWVQNFEVDTFEKLCTHSELLNEDDFYKRPPSVFEELFPSHCAGRA